MSQDAAGNVYVTGYIRNVSSGDDYLTVKYNSGGSQEWVSTYNNDAVNGGDMSRSICYSTSPAGEFVYVTGDVVTRTGRTLVMNMGTVKYNAADGTVLSALLYDGVEKLGSKGFEIISDNTGAVYVTGETTYKQTGADASTIKYEPTTLTTVASNSELNEDALPVVVSLNAYPNPARGSSVISFSIPQDGNVKLSVVDQLGQEVRLLRNAKTTAGVHYLTFDTQGLAQGTYIYRLYYNNTVRTRKVMLLR